MTDASASTVAFFASKSMVTFFTPPTFWRAARTFPVQPTGQVMPVTAKVTVLVDAETAEEGGAAAGADARGDVDWAAGGGVLSPQPQTSIAMPIGRTVLIGFMRPPSEFVPMCIIGHL